MGLLAEEPIQFVFSTTHPEQFSVPKPDVTHIAHREFVKMIDEFVEANGFSVTTEEAVRLHAGKASKVKKDRKLWTAYCPIIVSANGFSLCSIMRVLYSLPGHTHNVFAEGRVIREARVILKEAGSPSWEDTSIILEGPYSSLSEVPW